LSDSWLELSWLRPTIFSLGLLIFSFVELAAPFRTKRGLTGKLSNFFLIILSTLGLKLFAFTLNAGLALKVSFDQTGLFYQVGLGPVSSFIFSLLILDFAIYLQHRVFHKVPFLWRLHRVHHSDASFDVTTALRFHPLEILISFLFKWSLILLFGISFEAFLAFEIILNLSAMFSHSNFQLPKKAETWLSKAVVTPSFHRVHHSVKREQIKANFGFCLSVWDRIFGSFCDYADQDQQKMIIGLREYNSVEEQGLLGLLAQPFTTSNEKSD